MVVTSEFPVMILFSNSLWPVFSLRQIWSATNNNLSCGYTTILKNHTTLILIFFNSVGKNIKFYLRNQYLHIYVYLICYNIIYLLWGWGESETKHQYLKFNTIHLKDFIGWRGCQISLKNTTLGRKVFNYLRVANKPVRHGKKKKKENIINLVIN